VFLGNEQQMRTFIAVVTTQSRMTDAPRLWSRIHAANARAVAWTLWTLLWCTAILCIFGQPWRPNVNIKQLHTNPHHSTLHILT